jgi:hypothetical protein
MKTFAINLVLCCLLSAIPFLGFSQYDDEIPDSGILNTDKKPNRGMRVKKPLNLDNFFMGSGVSVSFWGNFFQFDVLPYFGYRIGDAIAPAIGFDYIYSLNYSQQNEITLFGPKVQLKLRPFKNTEQLRGLYVYGDFSNLTRKYKSASLNIVDKRQRANVGLGWTTNFEKGFGITTELLYDLFWLSPNGSVLNVPITYQVGFYYGF